MILDTTFLIDVLRDNRIAVDHLRLMELERVKTTSITAYELFQNAKEQEISRINNLLDNLPVLAFTREDAEDAGRIAKTLKDSGKAIDPEDCMIAAIALRENAPILTRNSKHFSRIPGLRIATY
jgi:predicted nucleic acid-binding protein